MSKSAKKLVSWLLCLAMAATSVTMMAFADDETTDTSVTETVETTAEPAEATEEPETVDETETTDEAAADEDTDTDEEDTDETETVTTVTTVSSAYDDDTYYQKALTLCTALGIIEGYEDGSVQPDSTVTRAQMAAIVLRMLNVTAESVYSNSFNDMTSDHWAANTVQTAAEQGIINGMGDGSFNPDGDVLYEQAVKMIVCALGYETDALLSGSYPDGYLREAEALEVTDHAAGATGKATDRGTIIKMVYNALLTPYSQLTSTDSYGNAVYTATDTLGEVKFDLIEEKGILDATSTKYTDSSYSDISDNQIAIDGVLYETNLTDLDDYVGISVTYYYQESFNTDPIVIAMTDVGSKSTTLELSYDQIKELSGFEDGAGVISMEKGNGSNKKCTNATINYNGAVITAADYTHAASEDPDRFYAVDEDGQPTSDDVMSFDEFLLPRAGSIKLIDTDNDGIYEQMFVTSYETMLVTSASSKKVTGKINNATTTINVDTSSNADLKVSVTKSDSVATARNLSKNDVVSILRTLDNQTITMTVSGESITGSATSKQVEDDRYHVTVNGDDYEVDPNVGDDAKTGVSSTFYLDVMGRIGYVESSSSGKLSGSEQYGMLMTTYMSDDGDDYMVRIYTTDGKAESYPCATSVSYWAGNAAAAVTLRGDNRSTIGDLTSSGTSTILTVNSIQIRLCKYKVNSSGELTQLYMATDVANLDDGSDGVGIDPTNYNGVPATKGVMLGGNQITDGAVGFSAPKNASDMSTVSNYSVFSVTASSYLNAENGISKDFVLGEFDDSSATVVIELVSNADSAALLTDYGTADDNNCYVVVRVSTGVDDDDDEIYNIRAIRAGSEVTITTAANTALYKMASDAVFNDREYRAEDLSGTAYETSSSAVPIWSAESSSDSLTKYLNEGDVIGVKGGVIIKMVDVEELANLVATGSGNQFTGYGQYSTTRDGIGIGYVANLENNEYTNFDLYTASGASALSWFLESSTTVTRIDVTTDSDGFVSADVDDTDTIEPSEIAEFDPDNIEGDYIFTRNFKNGAQREVFVFTFND